MKKNLLKLMIASSLSLPAGAFAQGITSDIIVSLQPESADVSELVQDYGLTTKHIYQHAFKGFAATVPTAIAEQLKADPRVLSISPDAPVRALADLPTQKVGCGWLYNCDDDSQVVPWGISRVAADFKKNTGSGIHVYVIDTGIDANHQDLAANLGNGKAVEYCLTLGCNEYWDDDQGHGTHVAGTIGAIDNNVDVVGVAPEVTLHAVKVLNAAGSGSNSGVIAGIDWVTQQAQQLGVPVVANMSLGGSGSKSGTCTNSGFSGSDNFHRAVCNAKNAGVVIAVAAGNDSADTDTTTPGAYDDAVITVSSTTINDDWSSFSNWGDRSAAWTTNQSAPVAIAAPGSNVLSLRSGGGTTTMSGTSMAAPHVAGALALYLEQYAQSANSSAFINSRSWLLNNAESTKSWNNTTGDAHDEDFLNANL